MSRDRFCQPGRTVFLPYPLTQLFRFLVEINSRPSLNVLGEVLHTAQTRQITVHVKNKQINKQANKHSSRVEGLGVAFPKKTICVAGVADE